MPKPFLELTEQERGAVVRVVAVRVPVGGQDVSWDVFLYSIGRRDPVAHEAPTGERGNNDDVESLTAYVDHYLGRLGLERAEEFSVGDGGLEARVSRVVGG
ncbi:hypothetical protein [Leifsonia sp. EB34]|uniref:hypothetical protein n=1 Tax=Leifsonia sp. EB34 TaxID=3156303 RepID=UPI00351871A1